MYEEAGQIFRLDRGCRQYAPMVAGSMILVRRGRVALRCAPEWLADCCKRTEQCLDAEDAYTVAATGWVELTALCAAEFVLGTARASVRRGLWRNIPGLLRALWR